MNSSLAVNFAPPSPAQRSSWPLMRRPPPKLRPAGDHWQTLTRPST
jgi:hypothetical protein